jgi:hypothetical protein
MIDDSTAESNRNGTTSEYLLERADVVLPDGVERLIVERVQLAQDKVERMQLAVACGIRVDCSTATL